MQKCPNCGTQLSAYTNICPHCGFNLATTPPNQITPSPYPTPPAYPSNTPQRSANFNTRTSPPKSGLSTGMTVLLVALAVLVMLGGVGLILYTGFIHPAQLSAQATATMQAFQTSTARASATMQAQASSTAQAYTTATALAQAKATAQAQATVTAQQNLYTHATSGQPALNESLAFQNGSNWDTYGASGGDGCAFGGSALNATITQAHFYLPCFAQASNFSNFALEMQMRIARGDEGGLIFRANNSTSQFYIFRIGRDGNYELLVSKDSKHNNPIAIASSPFIHTGLNQTNTLTLIAQNSSLTLYINRHFVSNVQDKSYQAGQIGVFAGANNNATSVAFSNLRVWNL